MRPSVYLQTLNSGAPTYGSRWADCGAATVMLPSLARCRHRGHDRQRQTAVRRRRWQASLRRRLKAREPLPDHGPAAVAGGGYSYGRFLV